ncbi:MAG: hypothetical protein IPI46_01835 [Bacteroidetes bacterium]|nr:hypothetical protein [Bacteroidota bacterium]
MKNKFYLIFFAVVIIILAALYFLSGVDGFFTRNIVLGGTLILALITLLSYRISANSADDQNPNKFVRGVMGATFLKFMLCIVAVGILLLATKKQLHKPDLYVMMLVYIIFSVVETLYLAKFSRMK